MKKILMTLSLALAAVIALPSAINAQDVNATQTEQKTECTNPECTKDKKDCKKDDKVRKGDCKDFKKGHRSEYKGGKMNKCEAGNLQRKGMRRDGGDPLFNGITLSAEQQQQFNAFRDKQRAERQAARAEKQKAKEAKKEARAAEMKAKREAFDKEVEKILTPEQMKQYNANKEKMAKERAQRTEIQESK